MNLNSGFHTVNQLTALSMQSSLATLMGPLGLRNGRMQHSMLSMYPSLMTESTKGNLCAVRRSCLSTGSLHTGRAFLGEVCDVCFLPFVLVRVTSVKNQDRVWGVIGTYLSQSPKYWGCPYKIRTSGHPSVNRGEHLAQCLNFPLFRLLGMHNLVTLAAFIQTHNYNVL